MQPGLYLHKKTVKKWELCSQVLSFLTKKSYCATTTIYYANTNIQGRCIILIVEYTQKSFSVIIIIILYMEKRLYMEKNPYFLWRTETAKAIPGFSESDCALVADGRARAYIVADSLDTAAQNAAKTLADAVEKMTGCRLSFQSFEGGTPVYLGAAALKAAPELTLPDDECFLLAVSKKAVFAAGNDREPFCGTAFSVTAMLEVMGFGWFGPDRLWQVVPDCDTARLPAANFISRPHFISRRNRVLEQEPELGGKWGLGGVKSEIEHKYGSFFPPAVYEQEHPEYYALSGGTRSTQNKKWWELCLSNEEVQRLMAEKVCEFFREHPDWKGLSIGQNDGNGEIDSIDYANWCECENCRKFAPTFSDAVLRFSNKVAALVYQEFPEHTLMFYGYFGTYAAPAEKCREPVSPNLQLTLCKECGFTGKIRTGEACCDDSHPPFAENFRQWKAQGIKHIAIYEWNCPGAANPAWKEALWVQGDVGLDNLKWFYENGVDFVYIDQGPNSSYERVNKPFGVRWMQWYCMARGCYNTSLAFNDIMSDACKKLFGNAAKEMLSFYSVLAQANAHCRYPHFNWGLPLVGEIYDDEYRQLAEKELQRAEAIGSLTPEQTARIAEQRSEWEKTKKMAMIQ